MARISLESFLEKNPDHPSAKAELGRVLLRLGDFSGGARELAEAAEATGSTELYLEHARAVRVEKGPKDAMRALKEARSKRGEDPDILLESIETSLAANEPETALQVIETLQKNWPRPEIWMARKAELLAKLGRAEAARVAWTALFDHIQSLPNFDRAQPFLVELEAQCRKSIGLPLVQPVAAPPAAPPALNPISPTIPTKPASD
jgi:Flp pilus assembly protein TadD